MSGASSGRLRVAQAQVTSGAGPRREPRAGGGADRRAAAAGARLVVFPEATMRCFGLPLGPVAAAAGRALGRRRPGDRRAARRRRRGRDVHPGAGRPGRPTPCSPPGPGSRPRTTRSTSTTPSASRSPRRWRRGTTLGRDRGRRGRRRAWPPATTCASPTCSPRSPTAAAQVVCLPASWGAGPGKVEQWQAADPGPGAGQHLLRRGRRPGRPAATGRPPGGGGAAPTGVGHSCAVGPDGTVLAELGAEPDLLVTELDLDEVARVRAALPVLLNRRRDLG